MARAGVNYHDVAQAAVELKAKGLEPTVDRIREFLGTGSKSTLAPLLKRWRAEHEESGDIQGLPQELVDALKSIHERVQQLADNRIELAKKAFEDERASLSDQLIESQQLNTKLEKILTALKAEHQALKDKNTEQAEALDTLRMEQVKIEAQRDEFIRGNEQLKSTIASIKEENKMLRDHFEHYQERVALDRQIERDQFQEFKQQLQIQLNQTKDQLTQAGTQLTRQLEHNEALARAQSELQHKISNLEALSTRQSVDLERLEGLREEGALKITEFKVQREQWEAARQALERQNTTLDKKLAVITKSADMTESHLAASRTEITALSLENKRLIQENANLRAHLKQQPGQAQA